MCAMTGTRDHEFQRRFSALPGKYVSSHSLPYEKLHKSKGEHPDYKFQLWRTDTGEEVLPKITSENSQDLQFSERSPRENLAVIYSKNRNTWIVDLPAMKNAVNLKHALSTMEFSED